MSTRRPRIAAIVPSLSGDGEELRRRLATQSWAPDEIQVVTGVRPNGRARNTGVQATEGDILFFIDDDAIPGQDHLIEALVRPLLDDPTVGVTGAPRILPANASWFQRRVAAEIPRTVNPVPGEPLETNPPVQGYGHSLITTTCCALPRSLYEEVGGFSEQLVSGVDTEFFYHVRRRGFRFLMPPHVYVEHPAPADLGALWRKFAWYGYGYGQETQRQPERRLGLRLSTPLSRALFLIAATLWFPASIVIPYSPGNLSWRPGFRPLKAVSTYAVAWGYVRAWRDGTK